MMFLSKLKKLSECGENQMFRKYSPQRRRYNEDVMGGKDTKQDQDEDEENMSDEECGEELVSRKRLRRVQRSHRRGCGGMRRWPFRSRK